MLGKQYRLLKDCLQPSPENVNIPLNKGGGAKYLADTTSLNSFPKGLPEGCKIIDSAENVDMIVGIFYSVCYQLRFIRKQGFDQQKHIFQASFSLNYSTTRFMLYFHVIRCRKQWV